MFLIRRMKMKKKIKNKILPKEVRINQHIGIYDNYILPYQCEKIIGHYKQQERFNKTMNRAQGEKAPPHVKNDNHCYVNEDIALWYDTFKDFIINFDIARRHYEEATGIKTIYNEANFAYTFLKLQKTLPGQGYHVWHVEHAGGMENSHRAMGVSVYLNDVEEGGETEFLHQSIRIKPKQGRIVIWPSGFPYVHRGNPPLKGEKYLLTSWLLLPIPMGM